MVSAALALAGGLRICRTAFAVALLPTTANDTALSTGGTPRMLDDHPSVVLRSERVRIEVAEKSSKVDCVFLFENTGREACTVRMGFPDEGYGGFNPDGEAGDDWQKRPPQPTLAGFTSWVQGKKVPTRVLRGDRPGLFWHQKTVTFTPRKKVTIRDAYVQPVGFAATAHGVVHYASYTLHTGAAWHGRIGSTEVIVTFRRKSMPTKLRAKEAVPRPVFPETPDRDWSKERGVVYYTGLPAPRVEGRRLRFFRKNWEPTKANDLRLAFDLGRQ